MSAEDDIAAIHKAHIDGVLFARTLHEESLDDSTLHSLFAVLSGEPGAQSVGKHHNVISSLDGYRGLAATALKKGIPIQLYAWTSNVGLLFDGHDLNNVNPVLVGSRDMGTHVQDGVLEMGQGESTNFRKIAEMQGFKVWEDPDYKPQTIDFSDSAAVATHIAKARATLPCLWDALRDMARGGWRYYVEDHSRGTEGCNETILIAHLRGVRGIVINELRPAQIGIEAAAERVRRAAKISKWLHSSYGDIFKEPPPVLSYEPLGLGSPQFEVIPQKQLQNPEEFYGKSQNMRQL